MATYFKDVQSEKLSDQVSDIRKEQCAEDCGCCKVPLKIDPECSAHEKSINSSLRTKKKFVGNKKIKADTSKIINFDSEDILPRAQKQKQNMSSSSSEEEFDLKKIKTNSSKTTKHGKGEEIQLKNNGHKVSGKKEKRNRVDSSLSSKMSSLYHKLQEKKSPVKNNTGKMLELDTINLDSESEEDSHFTNSKLKKKAVESESEEESYSKKSKPKKKVVGSEDSESEEERHSKSSKIKKKAVDSESEEESHYKKSKSTEESVDSESEKDSSSKNLKTKKKAVDSESEEDNYSKISKPKKKSESKKGSQYEKSKSKKKADDSESEEDSDIRKSKPKKKTVDSDYKDKQSKKSKLKKEDDDSVSGSEEEKKKADDSESEEDSDIRKSKPKKKTVDSDYKEDKLSKKSKLKKEDDDSVSGSGEETQSRKSKINKNVRSENEEDTQFEKSKCNLGSDSEGDKKSKKILPKKKAESNFSDSDIQEEKKSPSKTSKLSTLSGKTIELPLFSDSDDAEDALPRKQKRIDKTSSNEENSDLQKIKTDSSRKINSAKRKDTRSRRQKREEKISFSSEDDSNLEEIKTAISKAISSDNEEMLKRCSVLLHDIGPKLDSSSIDINDLSGDPLLSARKKLKNYRRKEKKIPTKDGSHERKTKQDSDNESIVSLDEKENNSRRNVNSKIKVESDSSDHFIPVKKKKIKKTNDDDDDDDYEEEEEKRSIKKEMRTPRNKINSSTASKRSTANRTESPDRGRKQLRKRQKIKSENDDSSSKILSSDSLAESSSHKNLKNKRSKKQKDEILSSSEEDDVSSIESKSIKSDGSARGKKQLGKRQRVKNSSSDSDYLPLESTSRSSSHKNFKGNRYSKKQHSRNKDDNVSSAEDESIVVSSDESVQGKKQRNKQPQVESNKLLRRQQRDSDLNSTEVYEKGNKLMRKRQRVQYVENSNSEGEEEDDYEKTKEKKTKKKSSKNKDLEFDADEQEIDSEDSRSRDSDSDWISYYTKKKAFQKKAAVPKNTTNKNLSEYEKMLEEKKVKNLEFLKSLGIEQAKTDLSEVVNSKRSRGRRKGEKREKVKRPDDFVPRVSNREKKNINYVEDMEPPKYDIQPSEITFQDVLKSNYNDFTTKFSSAMSKQDNAIPTPVIYDKDILKKLSAKSAIGVFDNPTALAWFPSAEDIVLALGSSYGYLGFCTLKESDVDTFKFFIHSKRITNVKFDPFNSSKLISSGLDGKFLCSDMKKEIVSELYNASPKGCTDFDIISPSSYIVGLNVGEVIISDKRIRHGRHGGRTTETTFTTNHRCHDSFVKSVHVHPVHKDYFLTTGNDNSTWAKSTVCLWDIRKISKPVVEVLGCNRYLNSAFFSPLTGKSILTTSCEGTINIFDCSNITESSVKCHKTLKIVPVNTQNKGQSKVNAVWLPNSDDKFAMSIEIKRLCVTKIYDKDLNVYETLDDGIKGARLLYSFHPYQSILASTTSTLLYLSV